MRRVAVLLVVLLVASACSSGGGSDPTTPGDGTTLGGGDLSERPPPDTDPTAAERLAAVLLDPSSDEAAFEATVEALARAGIAVHNDSGLPWQLVDLPASSLRLTRFQAANLVPDPAGSGHLGSDLDSLVAPSELLPPPSYLLAGYIAVGDTFGAELSRLLMADQDPLDPGHLVAPGLALALFYADLAPRPTEAPAALGVSAIGNLPSAAAGGFCADLKAFFLDTVADMKEAVNSFVADIPVFGVLVQILSWVGVNLLVEYTLDFIQNLIEDVTLFGQLKKLVGTVGLFVMAASSLQPWKVSFGANPLYSHYSVSSPQTGAFRVTAQAGADPLGAVRPCAELGSIDLPPADTVAGAKVEFATGSGFGEHLFELSRDSSLSATGVGELGFVTADESEAAHEHGPEDLVSVSASAHVDRETVLAITALSDTLFGEGTLLGFVEDLLGTGLVNEAQASLQKLLDLSIGWRSATAGVTFHEETDVSFEVEWRPETIHPYRDWAWFGVSCHGPDGPWVVQMFVIGHDVLNGVAGSGEGQFTLDLGTAEMHVEVPITGLPGGATGAVLFEVSIAAGDDLLTFVTVESAVVNGTVIEAGGGIVGDATLVYGNHPDCAETP